MNTNTQEPVQQILALFERAGQRSYGERVTVLDHSLQTAAFARQDGATDAMVIAALLHDIGHLVASDDEDAADQGIDDVHEEAGAVFLATWFLPEVVEPGRLHVAAKRYLCATDADYAAALSPASSQTLALQGGPFTDSQCKAFETNQFWREALVLRRYDDMGKVPGMEVPALGTYASMLEQFLIDASV